jgi:ankyrin repeat protein
MIEIHITEKTIKQDSSAISDAVRSMDHQLIYILFESGVPINAYDKYGQTPLFSATIGAHADLVHILLKLGADPNKGTIGGTPPMYGANLNQWNKEIKRLLIEAGAKQWP